MSNRETNSVRRTCRTERRTASDGRVGQGQAALDERRRNEGIRGNGGNGSKVDIPNRIQEVARREEEDKTRETALLIYTVLATPIHPPTHIRATHICTHTHICAHNHATHTTFSYATGARNRHAFQDRDIRIEVTTLFPRSRHPERGDDTLSKIETSGARCQHQQ